MLKRTVAALEAGLTPIVCVGERLEQREAGQTEAVLVEQFQRGIAGLTPEQFARIIIAYEPVWAIGTGKTATPEMAADAHRIIRAQVHARFGADAARAVRILYGGSVKPDNVKSLMAQPEIDGVLVGGAEPGPDLLRFDRELLSRCDRLPGQVTRQKSQRPPCLTEASKVPTPSIRARTRSPA